MSEEANIQLVTSIDDVLSHVVILQFAVSTIGICINIPHLLILSQSSMRISSTNSIMIGIAICDLAVLSENVYEIVALHWSGDSDELDPCVNYDTYWSRLYPIIVGFLWKSIERTSFWLGLFLAFIRLLIMKLPKRSDTFSKPILGYLMILIVFSLSSLPSLYYYSGCTIVLWEEKWIPGEECSQFSENYTESIYLPGFDDTRDYNEVDRNFGFMNGILRILVAILYPALALLLFFEIQKSAKLASMLSHRNSKERNRTARMILVMTVFYFIASAPGGSSEFVLLFFDFENNPILGLFVGYGVIFISVFYGLNATSHAVINFKMSTKYRKTVKSLLKWKKKKNQINAITLVFSKNTQFFFDMNEELVNFINDILENVFLIQFIVSCAGLVMNIPHLFILLQSSMRTSSTNSIMVGIALCDLIVLSENVYERVKEYWLAPSNDPCVNGSSYLLELFLLIGDFLRETCERASFWMGVFLALVRLLIMKLPGNSKKFSMQSTGFVLVVIILVLSSLHSYYYYSGYMISEYSMWKPGKKCTGYPAKYTEPLYVRDFEDNDNLFDIVNRYIFINGISRILISILYPILALFLVFEIRKSAKFAAESLSKRASEERNRTGRMILVMTVFYVIASAPGGASDFIQLFVEIEPNSILETLVGYGSIFISALFCFNATSHGIINFVMSSKYRDTVKTVLGLRKKDGRMFSITRSSTHA